MEAGLVAVAEEAGKMKIINKTQNFYILRFDLNEDVIDGIIDFCKKETIESAFFSGLGACKKVIVSYYDLEEKTYLDREYSEDLEIVSITGNIGRLNLKTAVHAHGVFSNSKYETIGGHIKELIVSATCEIHITRLDGSMRRDFDMRTGLNLLK